MKILKELFDTALIFTAVTLTFVCTYFTSYFVQDGTWHMFLYLFIFMGVVAGIKKLCKYYFQNFL